MNTLFVLFNMAAAFLLAYQAGKFATMIDYDRDVFNVAPDRMMRVYYIVDIILAVYFIIALFGQGIQIGGSR